MHFPSFISARAIARPDVESALGQSPCEEERKKEDEEERSLIGAETQLFRLSRDRNRIRAGRFAREQDLRETLSSRSICHRLGFLRCAAGPAIFFCSTLKPGNEGGGGGEKERKREGRGGGGNGRLSIGVAKSNVAAPPRKLVAEKASAIYKPPLFISFV